MEATKGNQVYTITEAEAEAFRKEGFDIIGDDGNIISYGVGKTVKYDQYMKLMDKYEELMDENAKLRSELTKAEKKSKKE